MPSESVTRKETIDRHLDDAGWKVSDRTHVIQEFFVTPTDVEKTAGSDLGDEHDSPDSREFSDYVLLGKNGKPVAVVEAKKSSVDAEIGREQAKQYCHNIQKKHGGDLPFCFYTNGYEIYFWNLGEAPPQRVHGFPTRQDLERLLYIRKHKKALTNELINTSIAGRDYQLQAVRAVMEGIAKSRREFLLVMATGTGKTRTCIAYLCDFRVLKIKTKFQDEGISKRTISLEDQKKLMLDGKDIEEIVFEGTDLEKTVTNHATNALIVKEFMEESIKDPTLNITAPGRDEEVETWKDVFGIEERYKAKCCAKNDGKYWLVQALDECANAGISSQEIIQKIKRNTKSNPWAEANFLKEPFLLACQDAQLI